MHGNDTGAAGGLTARLPVDRIYYESDRKNGGDGDLEILSRSMARHGLINAITVRAEPDGRYRIIAGRRRYEAAKLLGWETVEAKAVDSSVAGAEDLGLAENVNREDMSPLDEADLFLRQMAEGRDVKELALYYNRSVSAIYQRTRLARLAPELKTAFREGKIGVTAAAIIASLEEELQKKFYIKHRHYDAIGVGHAESFLHSVQKNSLEAVADKKCGNCGKRTRHTDKSLFPEEDGLMDVCFDSDCYGRKWTALLEKLLKKAKAAAPVTENTVVFEGIPKFYQGNSITLDKTGYQIKKYDYYENRANRNEPGAQAVLKFTFDRWQKEVLLTRIFYREAGGKAAEAAGSAKSRYAPEEAIRKVAGGETGGPAPEALPALVRNIDRAIEKHYGRDNYQISLDSAILRKLALRWLEKPRNLIRELLFRILETGGPNSDEKMLWEILSGLPWNDGMEGLETIAPERMIALAFAIYMLESTNGPSEPDLAEEDDAAIVLGGLGLTEYRELYNETAAELVAAALSGASGPEPEEAAGDGPGEETG